MTRSKAPRRSFLRTWLIWTAGFLVLPLAGFAGTAVVSYRTSLADLALMGALNGLILGAAQALALPRHLPLRWIWAAAMPALWALGWTITTLLMIKVDQQFIVFGSSGALVFAATAGLLLHRLLPCPPATEPRWEQRAVTA